MDSERHVSSQNNEPSQLTNSGLENLVTHCIKALDLFFVPTSFARYVDWPRIRSLGPKHFYVQARITLTFELARMATYSTFAYHLNNNYPNLMNQIYNAIK